MLNSMQKLLYFTLFPLVFLLCFLWQSRFVHAANNYIKNKDFYVYGITDNSEIRFMTIDDAKDAVINESAWTGGGEITYEWVDSSSILVHMKNVDCKRYTPWIHVYVPETTGYHFTSSSFGPWTGTGCAGTDAHYTGAAYIMDSTVQQYIGAQFGYSSVTFYREPNAYSIRYNGGDCTSGSMDLQPALYDQSVSLLDCHFQKSIPCHFDSNGGDAVADISSNATFLHWSRNNSDYASGTPVLNLSSSSGDIVDFQAVWGNASLTLPQATRTGYIFSGWYDSNHHYVGSSGSNYTYHQEQTLYAEWKPIQYTITYHSNGVGNHDATGNFLGGDKTVVQTFTYDSTGYIMDNSFSQNGFVFQNWNTARDGSAETYNTNQAILNLFQTNGKNLNLYAIWDTDFTLNLNGNGGTLGDGKTDIYLEHVNNDSTLPEYCFGKDYDIPYYTQQGWSLNREDFYYDDRVYYFEESIHKYHTNAADFLLNTMKNYPNQISTDSDGNITVTMYAIWDESPIIQSQDLYLTSDEVSSMTESDLINRLLDSSQVQITDREDAPDTSTISNWNTTSIPLQEVSVCQMDWDFLSHIGDKTDATSPEAGATTITYRAIDFCDNVTEYSIYIYVTSSDSIRSADDSGSVSTLYTRYVSPDTYNATSETGGVINNSKWNTDSNCKQKLEKALSKCKEFAIYR